MKNRFLEIFWTLPLVVICFVFVVPRVVSAQPDNDLIQHIVSVLHLSTTKEPGLIEKGDAFKDGNSYSDIMSPSREVKVSLTDRLKVFCSFKKAYSAIEEIYEKQNRDKYRAFFGINIAF